MTCPLTLYKFPSCAHPGPPFHIVHPSVLLQVPQIVPSSLSLQPRRSKQVSMPDSTQEIGAGPAPPPPHAQHASRGVKPAVPASSRLQSKSDVTPRMVTLSMSKRWHVGPPFHSAQFCTRSSQFEQPIAPLAKRPPVSHRQGLGDLLTRASQAGCFVTSAQREGAVYPGHACTFPQLYLSRSCHTSLSDMISFPVKVSPLFFITPFTISLLFLIVIVGLDGLLLNVKEPYSITEAQSQSVNVLSVFSWNQSSGSSRSNWLQNGPQ
mmetsp:Transcript_60645/g.100700  ORF Transcript_60645/g.100700 Transcript_60645/m.100700 type:complete len:265 (-) Transcript_60645:1043-1837(-)